MVVEKKVVEEVSPFLRVYDDGSVDRTWNGPPEFKFLVEPVPPHEEFIDGVATRDVTIDEKHGLRVRIYLPEVKQQLHHESSNEKFPVLLHFHGGGFCIVRPDWFSCYDMYSKLARSAEAIVVSVYYRLAPEHRLPAASDDGLTALLWLRSLARGESVEPWLNQFADFNRIFLIGDSAGGNLVHHVAARAGNMDLNPLRLAGGIPIHPGFVRSEWTKSQLEHPVSTRDMVDKLLGLAVPIGSNKNHPITCPIGPEAQSLQALKLPPFLLCVAENDVLRDTEMEYYEAMKKANKDVELLISPGMDHCFYTKSAAVNRDSSPAAVKMDPFTAAQTSALIEGITDFIKKH